MYEGNPYQGEIELNLKRRFLKVNSSDLEVYDDKSLFSRNINAL